MTINEATAAGIARLRCLNWSEETYLRLDLLPDGMRGPWIHLFDRTCQEAIGQPTPQVLLFPQGFTEDFVPYTGVIDKDDN